MHHKKGSHVGMVLSFVIFITFLSFIYTAMKPAIEITPSKSSLLEYLKKEIISQASDNLVSVSVTTTASPDENCWIITHDNFLNSDEFNYESMGVIVRDKNNEIIPSLISIVAPGNKFTVIDWKNKDNFSKLYYSNENFTSPRVSFSPYCDEGANSEYELGLMTSKKMIFESKLLRMIEKHNSSYIGLKKDLNIPYDSDFSISFIWSNGTEIRTSGGNATTSIFSGEYPITYVDSEARTMFGTLKIWVW